MDKYSVVDEWVLSDGYVSVEDWAFNSNYRYEVIKSKNGYLQRRLQ